ncbi:MAG: DUF2804 family protein [Bacilli bacterium]|nr:DUF2804 family protein [Bacilli bacterium]
MNVLLKSGKLLDDSGNLIASGFAFDLVKQYRRSEVLLENRLKEINKYYVISDTFALTLVVNSAFNSTFVSISFTDFEKNVTYSKTKVKVREQSRIVMTPSSKLGSIEYEKNDVCVEIYNDYTERKLIFSMKNFAGKQDFYCLVNMHETTNGTSVVACPFEKEQEFLYNQHINCMKVDGYVNIGYDHYVFGSNTRASMDWIRGVFPKGDLSYKKAIVSTVKDGIEIGFVFVDKLGSAKYATPNMIFHDMHACKLNEVRFKQEKSKDGIKYKITALDSQLDLEFVETDTIKEQAFSIYEKVDRKIIYGKYRGYIMFDQDRIEIDDLFGIIEVNSCKY